MCIIVDTNSASHVFLEKVHPDFGVIHAMISKSRNSIHIVYGGTKYINELKGKAGDGYQGNRVWQAIVLLITAGKARAVNSAKVDAEEALLKGKRLCRSDDEHIIALAKVSGSRFLVSQDKDLIADFKDARFLSPRGSTFSHIIKSHKHSLGLLDGIRKKCPYCNPGSL